MAKKPRITPGRPTPWRKLPTYDPGIPRALNNLFSQLKTWHDNEVRTSVLLQFLYERDKFRAKNGRFAMPSWVLQEYDWLGSMTYASPQRNIIKSRVDAVESLLFSAQPRLEIYAAGAGYEEQLVAEARAGALDGTINASKPREQRRRVARTGLIANFAACMPIARNNQVEFRALDIDRLYWDPHDARDDARGEPPREMHVVEFIDRDALIAWYRGLDAETMKITGRPGKLETLERFQATTRTRETEILGPYDWQLDTLQLTDSTDRIRIVHSYRVASSPLVEDGRYVCTAYDGASRNMGLVLVDRPFGRSTLPICYWSPYPAETGGIVGVGLASTLVETQRSIDFSMHRAQDRNESMGWPKVLIPSGTPQTVKDNLQAQGIGFVPIPSMDGPPVVLDMPALSQHDIAWIQFLVQASGEDQGIADAIASGGTTRGANASGTAMFEELERALGRVSDIFEAWSLFSLSLGRETLGAIEDACRYDKAFASHYKDPDGDPMRFDWADKSLPTAEYVLEVEQGSEFARTRPGRIARITEGTKLGIFTPEQAAAALRQSPDIRRLSRDGNAPERKIRRDLAQLMGLGGDPAQVVVTEDDDLLLAVRLASERIADAQAARAKPDTVLRLREYRRNAETMLEQRQAQAAAREAAAAMAAMGGAAPAGMAGPGPASGDLADLGAGGEPGIDGPPMM
jgi:hypothetical protein